MCNTYCVSTYECCMLSYVLHLEMALLDWILECVYAMNEQTNERAKCAHSVHLCDIVVRCARTAIKQTILWFKSVVFRFNQKSKLTKAGEH